MMVFLRQSHLGDLIAPEPGQKKHALTFHSSTIDFEYTLPGEARTYGQIKFERDDVLFEVKVSPLTMKGMSFLTPFVEHYTFHFMASLGLSPPPHGGGHMHIGLQSLSRLGHSPFDRLKTLYNFHALLFNHPHFFRSMMRWEKNFAIFPYMTSKEHGIPLMKKEMVNWQLDIMELENKTIDHAGYLSLERRMENVNLEGYFDDYNGFHDENGEYHYFESLDQMIEDSRQFMVAPEGDLSLYPAIRYHSGYRTLELRALRAQTSYTAFKSQALFFALLMGKASRLPMLSLKSFHPSPFELGEEALRDLTLSEAEELLADLPVDAVQRGRVLKVLNPDFVAALCP